jgi:transcriptional regulator with XRE-family HTH domain
MGPEDRRLIAEVGRRLRLVRGYRTLKIDRLASLSRVSASSITNFELGRRDAYLTRIARVARALEVSIDDLVAPLAQVKNQLFRTLWSNK